MRPAPVAVPLAAAAAVWAGCSGAGHAKRTGAAPVHTPAATVLRRCDQHHTGVGQGGVTPIAQRQALRVGPIALGALGTLKLGQLPDRPTGHRRYVAIESIVVVNAGADVTIAVPPGERRVVGLIYDQGKFRDDGAYRVDELDSVARFVACDDPAFNHGISQYDGGIVIAGRRCFTLDFYVRGRLGKIERRVPAGGGCTP